MNLKNLIGITSNVHWKIGLPILSIPIKGYWKFPVFNNIKIYIYTRKRNLVSAAKAYDFFINKFLNSNTSNGM